MPKVSIIIPAYNSAKYLPAAIESALNQTYQDFEIIVVDDGSNDNTREIVNDYIKKYQDKLKYFFQNNQGISGARNKGIEEAKSDLLAFLDADDIYMQDFLKYCIKYLDENNCDLVMADNYYEVYDERNNIVKKEPRNRENYEGNENMLFDILFTRFQKGFSGDIRIVIKKEALRRIGNFDKKIYMMEDWDLWLRIAKNNLKIGYIKKPLFVYRRYSNSICRDKSKEAIKLKFIYHVLEKHKKDAFIINKRLIKSYQHTLWMLGATCIVNRLDLFLGIKCLLQSRLFYFNFYNKLKGILVKNGNGKRFIG